jgi:hypothetical protein
VQNPNILDRWVERLRSRIIGWLQPA